MLPARLKAARKAKKLTQAQLAKLLGKKNTAVSGWETGYSKPAHDDLIKLTEILEVSMDYLLGKTDVPNVIKDDVDLKELIDTGKAKWDGQELTPEQLIKAKNVLEFILKNND